MMELITKLEEAKEGSRDLDGLIGLLDNPEFELWTPDWWSGGPNEYLKDDGPPLRYHQLPHYTTSIDAALTLVPEGWFVETISDVRTRVVYKGDTHKHQCWRAALQWAATGGNLMRVDAPTPALAICIAALNTRIPR